MDPIIRTCSLFALVLALTFAPQTVSARRVTSDPALESYVQARVASAEGRLEEALAGYSAALTADPGSASVALRAYRQAMDSGNKPLAIRALRSLEAANAVPVDGRLLLISESFLKSDWRNAQTQIDRLEEAGTLAFLTPVLRAWMMQGSGLGNPMGALAARTTDGLSAAYVDEHRGLLLLAAKQVDEGVAAINAQRSISMTSATTLQLRLAGAQRLVELKKLDAARAMLGGDQSTFVTAREELAAGRPVGQSVTRANTGMAMLLAHVANDLVKENASPVGLTLARLSTFVDPAFAPARLVSARALAANGLYQAGIAELSALPRNRATAEMADMIRLDLLLSSGQFAEALLLAKGRSSRNDASAVDLVRYAEVLARSGRHADAAAAYANVIEQLSGPDRSRAVPWNIWLVLGREYDSAKNWAKAKSALQRAVELGPNEPTALNHLGYAMLVNGESVSEATRLIAKANTLKPDDPAISDSLGWALLKGGKTQEAILILERASESEPTIAEIGEHLGDAYWASGRRVDARYAWRAAQIQAEESDAKRLAAKIEFGPPPQK